MVKGTDEKRFKGADHKCGSDEDFYLQLCQPQCLWFGPKFCANVQKWYAETKPWDKYPIKQVNFQNWEVSKDMFKLGPLECSGGKPEFEHSSIRFQLSGSFSQDADPVIFTNFDYLKGITEQDLSNGRFQPLIAGPYLFSLSTHRCRAYNYLVVKKNGGLDNDFYARNVENYSKMKILHLGKNDIIHVAFDVFENGACEIQFIGIYLGREIDPVIELVISKLS